MDNYTAIIGKYAGKHSGKALTQYKSQFLNENTFTKIISLNMK